MSLLQTTLHRISKTQFIPLVGLGKARYSVKSVGHTNTFHFQSEFTQEEQTKILNTLNECDRDQLSRFHVSQNRIKHIESWKSKRGPFRSLSDVLEVEGLGEKLLHKICEDIVNERLDSKEQLESNRGNGKSKRNKQLVTPVVNGTILNNITSAVGIHLSSIGISWAKINKNGNKLVNLNSEHFSSLPKKMLPDDTFNQSINIVKKIPPSDIYIFGGTPSLGPQSQNQSPVGSAYTQQLELNAMLLALLNTSVSHNVTLQSINGESPPKSIENRVFYFKYWVPARLFNTLVGQEKVSAIGTINELMNNERDGKFSLPCTPITVDQQLKNAFNSQSPARKELLGQALMLIISFMDLCVYQNPVSLSTLSPNKKSKK